MEPSLKRNGRARGRWSCARPVLLLLPLWLGACAGEDARVPDDDPRSEQATPPEGVTGETQSPGDELDGVMPLVPPVECGTALPGPPLFPEETEAVSGYAEEVAATDLSLLPEEIDFSGANVLQQIVINFMLGTTFKKSFTRTDAAAAGPVGAAVLVAAARGNPGNVDFGLLRRGLAHFYPCSRPLPASLDVLKKRYGDYKDWPNFLVECSSAKNKARRVFQSHEQGVFIAETLEADGVVRETEVIFSKLRSDGHLDFAVYTEEGALTDRSNFLSSRPEGRVRSSPFFCAACHMSQETGALSIVFPASRPGVCH